MHPPYTFTIIDTETTGMRAAQDRIIEIGIIRMRGGVIEKTYKTFLNPGRSISPFITSINGIRNEDLVAAPTFDEVALDIQELCEDAVFVAHNASFDYEFVKVEFRRIGMRFKAPVVCSVKLSRALFPGERSHNLDALIERHKLKCEDRHRAYDDAHAVYQFMQKAEKKLGAKKVSQAIEDQLSADSGMLAKSSIRALPDTPGVYHFYDSDHEPIYIGKSKNIRTRVRSHFSDSAHEAHLSSNTASIEVEETPGELSALLLESHQIKNELPRYNRALRKRKKMIAAFERSTPEGYLTVDLVAETEIDPSRDIAAVFRTMTSARATLREYAREYSLCEKIFGLEKCPNACFGYSIEKCNGACFGKEEKEEYNKRFKTAFKKRRLRTWPFRGAVMIEEKGTEEAGAIFIIKEWRIIASYKYDNGSTEEFLAPVDYFDYDTYKILARYILNYSNRRSIKEIGMNELAKVQSELRGEHENVVY